jgi:hypothetical protein
MREKELIYHEAYYWMEKQEEAMWAKDKICFQRLVLNEMKQTHKHRQMGSRNDRNGNRSSTNNRSMDAAKRWARKILREEKERTASALSH